MLSSQSSATAAGEGVGAAAAIVRAIERRRKRLLIGADARAAAFVQWLMPVRYWAVVKLRYAAYLIGRRPS